MKSALPVLILLMTVLSACGSGTALVPSAGDLPVNPVLGAPLAGAASAAAVSVPAMGVGVTAAVLGDNGNGTASLRFSGSAGAAALTAQTLNVSVESVPAGVSLQLQAPSTGSEGVTLNMTVQSSTPAARGDIWLNVRQNGQTQRVRLPVLRTSSAELPSFGGSRFLGAVSAPCGKDVLLSAPANASYEQRTHLLRLNPVTRAVQSLDLKLGSTEGVTSELCAPDGSIWLTLRSDGAQGSVIARFQPETGTLERFPVGAMADTLNALTRTPDGRLWFVQYQHDRLGEFDPQTGRVISHAVSENAENLRLGQDGALYYSQFYARPAIVRYDPSTNSSTELSVGASGKNLPRASVETDGAVWYVDAWAQTLNRLDLQTNTRSVVALPTGAVPGELVADQGGTLWVADAAKHVLYRLAAGSQDAVTVPLMGNSADGPRALSVDAGGQLWYESAGQLVGQQ